MKKFITFVAAIGFSAMANAQVIAQLGFETGEPQRSSAYALTPGLSSFGDWVNVKEGDVWTEQCTTDKHSGEYAFQAQNVEPVGNTWDRGFKIAGLDVKEGTPYRVSFWIKGPAEGSLSSWLSKGIENYDKSICTSSGQNFGVEMTQKLTGDWQRVAFVSYYYNAEAINTVIASQSWVGSAVFPESFGGDGTQTYAEHFENQLPEEFFFVANMYSPGTYTLDDILIEEGPTFAQATFYSDVVKFDFGYPTNIAKLASNAGGTLVLDPSLATVTIDGQPAVIDYLEGKTDGYLYAFLNESTVTEDNSVVTVSFAGDPQILYNTDRRPSGDYTTEMAVLPVTDETAYLDEYIDVFPSAWTAPELVSTEPENNSFELESSKLNKISLTYDKVVDIGSASAVLTCNGKQTDYTNAMNLSTDKMTLNIALIDLADGEYTMTVSDVASEFGISSIEPQVVNFSVGEDHDTGESKTVYSTDSTFAVTANGTFPVGWIANDNGTIHQYGLTDGGEVWNYNWGGNLGGGGCRAMTGYSGDFNGAAIYWRSMNGSNNLGTLTFGEQVKDFILDGGEIDPTMDPNIALYLDANKYQITIKMAAWKFINDTDAPKYTFTLEDLEGNVYAEFADFEAAPNVAGKENIAVTGCTVNQADFTVPTSGYYMIKCSTIQPNGEYLLGAVDIITMPSKAAYYKGLLKNAVTDAQNVYAEYSDELYAGETQTALANEITNAQTAHFTSPSAINAEIALLQDLSAKLKTRAENIDNFSFAIEEADPALEELKGTKYENTQEYQEAYALINKYMGTDPSTLSDDELNAVSPSLTNMSGKLSNAKSVADVLSWRAYKAYQVANKLGQGESAQAQAALNLVEDDDAVVDAANVISRQALYALLAEQGALPAEIMDTVRFETGEYEDEGAEDPVYKIAAVGLDFTSLIKNPKFYTFATVNNAADDTTFPGWSVEQINSTNGNLHFNGDACSEILRATQVSPNNYRGDYCISQYITNVPVGVYTVFLRTRTCTKAVKTSAEAEETVVIEGNGQNDDTGLWDKYIYAQVGNNAKVTAPFKAGDSWYGYPTVIANIQVEDEGNGMGSLNFGAVEEYLSGKNVYDGSWNYTGEDGGAWHTNTTMTDARIYFTAPLAGYNYATAIENVAKTETTGVARYIYTPAGTRVSKMQKGVNIVKYSDGTVNKVLVK